MPLYWYIKAPPGSFKSKLGPSEKRWQRFFSFCLVGLGVFVITVVLGSMGFYQLKADQQFRQKPSSVFVLGQSSSHQQSIDYTQVQHWFSNPPSLPVRENKITHYNLSIPVLGIHEAVVEVGGEDLGKSMIHYVGTSLPGEWGNAVVFCHSVLPQFFNPQNYKTICSTLPTVEIGDEILVFFDGIEYRYQIMEMVEVEPEDISVLDQNTNGEYLSMITCVPPGTYLKRLVVRARLID